MWKTINSLLHDKTKSTDFPAEIKTDMGVVDDPLEIAICLTEHFCSIGKNLARNVRNDNEVTHLSFLTKSVSASMFLQPASVSELYNAIMSLSNYKSPGYDNIPVYFLCSAADILAFPLSVLVNFSFELGCFPNCLKTAKVIPLYKSGDKTLATNYRPVSYLTCFSKILKKLIFTRLTNIFDQNSVIFPTQYGFRKSQWTSHAVLDVVTTTYDSIDDNKYSGLVFLNLKKKRSIWSFI